MYYKTGNEIYIGDPFGDAQELTKEQFDELIKQKALTEELALLKKYLFETDWIVNKCYELGLKVHEEYPDEFVKRQDARIRINDIEKLG